MEIENKYRGLPFWSLNGRLNKKEIIRQVHVMKDMGFGGFFIHSRTGLETEYLGDEWFDIVKAACFEADKIGIKAWLYDEDRWPSGTAGGEVTKNKSYRLKFFSMYDMSVEEFSNAKNDENLLNIFAVKLSGEDKIIDYYIYGGGEVKSGYTLKKVILEYMECQDFYNGYAYLDTLNIDATNAFIKSTHQKYKEQCGDMFGKQILGIFTDEPHRGAIMNGFGINNANKMNMLPATYETCNEFSKQCGYSLKNKLIELYYILDGETINKTMFDYIGVTQNMFISNFAKPYHDWCKENNLILTGHVLHEDTLSIQTVFQGSVQRFYEFMDYPGMDNLTENNNAYWVAKQVQSVVRQLQKPFALSELYGATGWQMNFESHRDIGAWQALLGINLRCHHLSWYTMEGESKRDYPASIFYQSGWYKDYKYVEDYFARANQILSSGKPVVDVLVLNPVESVWMYPKKGWLENIFSPTVKQVCEIEESYYKLYLTLTESQIDFDYGDEDILARHFSIINKNTKPILQVGAMQYSTVVLCNNQTIRQSTLDILNEFLAVGGDVICVGEKPEYINAVKTENILASLKTIEFSQIKTELQNNSFIFSSENLFSTLRKVDDYYYIALLNINRKSEISSEITFKDNFSITEIRLENGEEIPLFSLTNKMKIPFNNGEMRVFKLSKKAILIPKIKVNDVFDEYLLTQCMNYALNEPNILPLDMPSYIFRGKEYNENEVLQVDKSLRDLMGLKYRSGDMIQPWFRKKYLQESKTKAEQLILTHTFFIEKIPQNISLVLEQSELYDIIVNNKKVDILSVTNWIDDCFDKIQLDSDLFIIGKNTITLTVDYDEDVNLEAAYLIGDFGVKLTNINDKTIIDLPAKLEFGDITTQGLPFYSGEVTYKTGIKNEKIKVSLDDCYGAFAKIQDDKYEEVLAFSPYESKIISLNGELKITVSLTRRNTFGPLHLTGIYAGAYGPEAFIDERLYKKEYSLIKQGILNSPKITTYRKE